MRYQKNVYLNRVTLLLKFRRRLLVIGAVFLMLACLFGYSHLFHSRSVVPVATTLPEVITPPETSIPSVNAQNIQKVVPSTERIYGISLGDTFVQLPTLQMRAELSQIKNDGFTQVRFTISWYAVQPTGVHDGKWQNYDRIVSELNKANLKGVMIIQYTPAWARQAACKASAYCAPAVPAQYGEFAGEVAKRYGPMGIHEYEIWNEENIKSFWQPSPSAIEYAAILKAAYFKIKAVEVNSTVISGGMSGVSVAGPGYLEPRDYLAAMYAAGAKGTFDALGYHAYTFPDMPNIVDGGKNAWSKMAIASPSLRSIMEDNGDSDKKIWVTEVGAPTNGPGAVVSENVKRTSRSDHVDTALQSQIVSQVLDNSSAMPWLGGLFWYTYKDMGTAITTPENFYGLLNNDGSPKPALSVFTNYLKLNQ